MRKRDQEAIEHQAQMWRAGERSAADPGLRDRYAEIPRLPIRLICSRLDKEINHGNLLRIAEAYRLDRVYLSQHEEVVMGSMGGHAWQPHEFLPAADAIARCRQDGYAVYALDICESAVDIHATAWQFPAALAIGEELTGMELAVREMCDHVVAIPLYGMMQSLNVAVATGICIDQMATKAMQNDERYLPVRAISRRLLQ